MKNRASAFLSAIFWGFDPVLVSLASGGLKTTKNKVFFVSFAKELISLLMVVIIFNKKISKTSKKNSVILLVGGVFGGGISLSLYVASMAMIGFGLSDLFISLYPIVMMGFSRLFFKEKFDLYSVLGIFIIVIGSVVVGFDIHNSNSVLGIIFALLGAVSYAIEIVCVKFVGEDISLGTMLFWKYLGSTLFLILALMCVIPFNNFISIENIFSITIKVEILLIVLAGMNAFISYIFYYFALVHSVRPSIIVAINSSYILIAMTISWAMQDSSFDVFSIIGVLLIFSGLLVLNIQKKLEV